jgi:hypothetical protein
VYPINLDSFLQEAQSNLNKAEQLEALTRTRKVSSAKESSPTKAISQAETVTKTVETPPKNSKTRKKKNLAADSLPAIAAIGEKQKLTAYEALKQAGLIRPATEYLLEEVG